MQSDLTAPALTSTSRLSPAMSRLLQTLAWLFVAVMVVKWGFYKPIITWGVDFDKHWLAARALLEGRSVYRGEVLYLGFNYPQLTAYAYIWLGWFDMRTAALLFDGVNTSLLFGTWMLAWRGLRPAAPGPGQPVRAAIARQWALTTAFAFCMFQPTLDCLPVANIDPYNAILIMGCVVALRHRRPFLAGVLWMLVVQCKLLPVVLGLVWVLWRQWRLLAGGALVLGLYYAFLLAVGRVGEEMVLYREVLPQVGYYWRHISGSLQRGLLHFIGADVRPHGDVAHFIYDNAHNYRLWTYGCLSLPGFAYLGTVMRLWRVPRVGVMRALESALLFIPIITPLLEYHHFVFSLPALYLQLDRWISNRMAGAYAIAYFIGWVALSHTFVVRDLWPRHPLGLDFLSVMFGVTLVVISMVEAFRQPPAPERDREADDSGLAPLA